MTALALREDQDYWDERQLPVLRQMGIGDDVTKPELTAFLHECQQRRLDPFTRQIYLIGRFDRRAGRQVYRSQTGIDGFRLIARRAADRAGETIEYEDTLWCAADGKWTDVWLGTEPPAACKVVVLRNGKRYPVTVRYAAYVQTDRDGNPLGLWQKMPDNQIEKCAEAKALRKAFPEELGGIYTDDEMAQADNPQRVTATVEVISDERADAAAEEWADAAAARVPGLASKDACAALWRESAEMVRDGKCTKAGAYRVQQLITGRLAELGDTATEADEEARAEQALIGALIATLPPEDPWAPKLDELGDEDDARAALDEVIGLLKAKEIDVTRANQIRNAILARFPKAAAEGQRAA